MSDLLQHKYGRRVVLNLLAPFSNRYVPVEYQEWIRPNSGLLFCNSTGIVGRFPPAFPLSNLCT